MKNFIRSRCWQSSTCCLVLTYLSCGNQIAAAVDFNEIARFDISATSTDLDNPPPDADDIGVNAVAVAYNGTKLYLAGYNNSGLLNETSIIEITNPTATGLVTPSYSAKFGTDASTPAGRGFSGLALSPDGTKLAASFDDGFNNLPDPPGPAPKGLQVFDTSSNSQLWQYAERGGSGVDFDPGYPGGDPAQGSGVAYVESFGSGRRALLDSATGSDIWTPTDGMIWIPNEGVSNNFTRDIAFDPATGDMYIRSHNDLFFADRNGDNSTDQANNALLLDLTDGNFINYQHVAFLNTTNDGDLLILNDRNSGATGQDFFTVNQLVDTAGASQTMNFSWLPNADASPFLPDTGAGWYDYDFDATTQTLALLDTSNRLVHIFQVGNADLPGDYSGDGFVGQADLDLVLLNWGDTVPPDPVPEGWVNQQPSGLIGQEALDGVLLNWGDGAAPALAVVPEPSASVLLLGLATIGSCARGRRCGTAPRQSANRSYRS